MAALGFPLTGPLGGTTSGVTTPPISPIGPYNAGPSLLPAALGPTTGGAAPGATSIIGPTPGPASPAAIPVIGPTKGS
jgi:hypothetical protein